MTGKTQIKNEIRYRPIFQIFQSSSNVWSCLFQNLDSKKFVENRKRTGINVFRALNYYVFIYRSSHREIIGLSHWKASSLSNPNIALIYRDMIRYFNLMKKHVELHHVNVTYQCLAGFEFQAGFENWSRVFHDNILYYFEHIWMLPKNHVTNGLP